MAEKEKVALGLLTFKTAKLKKNAETEFGISIVE